MNSTKTGQDDMEGASNRSVSPTWVAAESNCTSTAPTGQNDSTWKGLRASAASPAKSPTSHDSPVAATAMAASTQQRWLSQPRSRVATADLVNALRHEDAWHSLPKETRETLYGLLPPPREDEASYDADVHPLKTPLKPLIEASLRTWQQGLADGKEVESWRDQALQAERDRADGKWDDFRQYQRDADWGSEDQDGAKGE